MKKIIDETFYFFRGLLAVTFRGGKTFYLWMSILTVLTAIGLYSYLRQINHGLIIP